jgi:hypothetical protein
MGKDSDEQYNAKETKHRADKVLLRLLKMPPQTRPHRDRKPSRPNAATGKRRAKA